MKYIDILYSYNDIDQKSSNTISSIRIVWFLWFTTWIQQALWMRCFGENSIAVCVGSVPVSGGYIQIGEIWLACQVTLAGQTGGPWCSTPRGMDLSWLYIWETSCFEKLGVHEKIKKNSGPLAGPESGPTVQIQTFQNQKNRTKSNSLKTCIDTSIDTSRLSSPTPKNWTTNPSWPLALGLINENASTWTNCVGWNVSSCWMTHPSNKTYPGQLDLDMLWVMSCEKDCWLSHLGQDLLQAAKSQ